MYAIRSYYEYPEVMGSCGMGYGMMGGGYGMGYGMMGGGYGMGYGSYNFV